VLFDVAAMADYGKLSNRNLDEQQAGARVAVDAHKKNPGDFVLWKLSSADEPGWESPWGRGRPGWHIECSVMSKSLLGEVFDIHGGGLDLIFPHHENEIAQSRCAHDTSVMANYWMHNGFLQVEGQKMSKSLGNFTTIADVFKEGWHGYDARLAMLRTHYRQPIDWTFASLQESRRALMTLQKWYSPTVVTNSLAPLPEGFLEALSDDLNVHEALVALRKTMGQIHSSVGGVLQVDIETATALIKFSNAIALLGFGDLDKYHSRGMGNFDQVENANVETLITARLEARKAKDWKRSDDIRDELAAMGIQIKDNKDGTTTWEVKR
jgi:cysteinyl-tRNA synthetase